MQLMLSAAKHHRSRRHELAIVAAPPLILRCAQDELRYNRVAS
jgi:hypothetical protein